MVDFKISECEFVKPDSNSVHLAYKFRMSVRDLALFGQFMLNEGKWNGEAIVSQEWLTRSLTNYSINEKERGVGYLWNIENNGKLWGDYTYPDGSFGFSGYPGHFLLVIPTEQLVIVYEHQIGTTKKEFMTSEEFGELVSELVVA
jgi:CubicO group peptidase (beta-lactamase class C family)